MTPFLDRTPGVVKVPHSATGGELNRRYNRPDGTFAAQQGPDHGRDPLHEPHSYWMCGNRGHPVASVADAAEPYLFPVRDVP